MSETHNAFMQQSTKQDNQLRIALISISVGLFGFFAKELNRSVTFSQYPYLHLTVIFSLLAGILGLLAWFCSARMFYAMGEDDGESRLYWHRFKHALEIALPIILALGVFTALMHLFLEKTAKVTGA